VGLIKIGGRLRVKVLDHGVLLYQKLLLTSTNDQYKLRIEIEIDPRTVS
jgi:hypothetical protein